MPYSDIEYRGNNFSKGQHDGHTLTSRAMLVILVQIASSNYNVEVKQRAIKMQADLVKQSVQGASLTGIHSGCVCCNIYGGDGQFHSSTLQFADSGMTRGLGLFLNHHAGAADSWGILARHGWLGHEITSTVELASIWDILIWATWVKAHPAASGGAWNDVVQYLYPKLIFICGTLMDLCCRLKAGHGPEAFPLLQSKKGHTRKVPRVNKWLLLRKVKAQRKHRSESMRSHADLVPSGASIVQQEATVEVCCYMRNLLAAFQNSNQVMVAWDASQYDVETLVGCVFDWRTGAAGFLPVQNLEPVLTRELHPEIRDLIYQGKSCRIDSYQNLRAFSHMLQSIGLPLAVFEKPPDLLLGPFSQHESRVEVDGEFWVYNKQTQQIHKQVPHGLQLGKVNLLTSMSDMGPVNLPCLDLCQYHLGLLITCLYDPYHRVWNDIKAGLRKASLFRTMLEFSLFYNVSWGPSGTKRWYEKKKAFAKEFLDLHNADDEPFLSYMPFVARELGVAEPQNHEERTEMFRHLLTLPGLSEVGATGEIVPVVFFLGFPQIFSRAGVAAKNGNEQRRSS